MEIKSSEDELWFYGFSRGACKYLQVAMEPTRRCPLTHADVVTAVAGLLHKVGALVVESDFDETYEVARSLHGLLHRGSTRRLNTGRVCCTLIICYNR